MRFAITGVAGFVAPRHLDAIRAVGGELVAALDPVDSVGILDKYNPDCAFFTEPEPFERFLDRERRQGLPIDWLVVCAPNHLHDAHVRMGLRNGCNVICEKPLVLNPENLDAIADLEAATGRTVRTVLQLRLNPHVVRLRHAIENAPPPGMRYRVRVHYTTPRGRWYHRSWKADPERSGGLATNIGVHLFDVLIHLFGAVEHVSVESASPSHVFGKLTLARADVDFHLSIARNAAATRELQIDGVPFDLNEGFTDAHTRVYQDILAGRGYGVADARAAVALCWRLRRMLYT